MGTPLAPLDRSQSPHSGPIPNFQTASPRTRVNKGMKKGRSCYAPALGVLPRLEAAYVLALDRGAVLAGVGRGRRGALERALYARGIHVSAQRREIECPTSRYVGSGHGGAAHGGGASPLLRRDDAHPWRPDIHAGAIVAPGGLFVARVSCSCGDYAVVGAGSRPGW